MFDRDLLAAVMAVMPRMRGPAMQGVAAYDFFSAGPMARAHLVSSRRLRLRGLGLRRYGGRRRGRSLGEGGRAQAESDDTGKRQHKLIYDVLLGVFTSKYLLFASSPNVITSRNFPNYNFPM